MLRVDNFLRYIDLNYDVMPLEAKTKLNKYVNSSAGKEILSTYVDGITQTSSERLRMATAILYCKDPDFIFLNEEIEIFLNSCSVLNDSIIDFYLLLDKTNPVKEDKPYARFSITQKNENDIFGNSFSTEQIFSYVNILIQNRLLLPDPTPGGGTWKNEWHISFGKSKITERVVRLIQKADYLLNN